jgi:hypothetical protein
VFPNAFVSAAIAILSTFNVLPAHAATRYVDAGGDLQAALDAARPGDEVVLAAGARFVGEFVLPIKAAGAAIAIRSSMTLPDRRLTPADAPLLPILASESENSPLTGVGTSNWRLDGLRFESNALGAGNVISLQDATNITLDRLLIVAGPAGQKRGIMGNGRQIVLSRSHIANIWRTAQDSQAFCAWDGAGPYTIIDNYLEAASENVMFGGANSGSADRVPADILVEGNHFSKPLSWKGAGKYVKNLFELKSAKRVIARNNLFEHNWTDAQSGWAILFTVRNDQGDSPWSVIEDVLFERNVVRDTEGVFSILGYNDGSPSGRTTRITIRHNLTISSGAFLSAGGEIGTLTFDHNTVDQGGNFATLYTGNIWVAGAAGPRAAEFAIESLTVTNTLANHNDYGVLGDSVGIGTPALAQLTRTYTWTHNVLAGESGWGYAYPVVTWQPSMTEHRAQFVADYRLAAGSWYRGAATDAGDLGVVWDDGVPPPPEPDPIQITSSSPLPDAFLREPYSVTLTATRAGQWRLLTGALPAGLTLAGDGTISGVPTRQGSATFTVEVSDGASTASASLTIRVRPRPKGR